MFMTLIGLGQRAEMVEVLGRGRTWDSVTPFVPPRHLKPRGRNSLRGQIEEELAARGFPGAAELHVQLDDNSYTTPEIAMQLFARRHDAIAVSADARIGDLSPPRRVATQWRLFRIARTRGGQPPPMQTAIGIRVVFREPVLGPISIGYGSHFGLGQLRLIP